MKDFFEQKKFIAKLRKQIPEFKCIPGCTDCCGPLTMSTYEYSKIKNKKRQMGIDCPYINTDKGCEIYEDRPILCRVFGCVESLKCPHGCGPAVLLTSEQETELVRSYILFNQKHGHMQF